VHDGLQACPYLEGRVARMPLWRQLRRLTLDETDARFARSERRVGTCLYRTECPACSACEGLRIPVATFRPTKSQRRVARKWEGRSRVELGPPTLSARHLDLFRRHKNERGLRKEDDEEIGAEGYVGWLVQSCTLTIEMRYFHDDALVGIGVVDLGRRAASSVYFYFDPDFGHLSPGTWSVLQELELCRRTGREHLYLGLWVEQSPHLAYKADFGPHERLRDGDWRPSGRLSEG
jgi:arginyl-tRNA--protein-N-Asp/Glu arginylyltransferase